MTTIYLKYRYFVEKICKRCGEKKRIQKFKTDKRNKDGRSVACRECYEKRPVGKFFRTPEQIESQRSKILGRKYTLEHRLAISRGVKRAVKEGKHHWKKRKFPHEDQDRTHIEYKIWKRILLDRCGAKCEDCGRTDRLHAHHIKCYYIYPKLRFDVNNGKILCISCHMKYHRNKDSGKLLIT